MGKAQKQRIQRLVWCRLAAGVLGTAIIGLTALGPSSWRFLAAAIGLFPLLLLLSWGYEREKRREDALREAGYLVLRVTSEDLRGPATLASRVLRVLPRGIELNRRPLLRG